MSLLRPDAIETSVIVEHVSTVTSVSSMFFVSSVILRLSFVHNPLTQSQASQIKSVQLKALLLPTTFSVAFKPGFLLLFSVAGECW